MVGTTNSSTVPLRPSLVNTFTGLADFRKFDNFSRFFHENSAENCRTWLSKDGKDASQWDLHLSRQNFSSKMNSLGVILEKREKWHFLTYRKWMIIFKNRNFWLQIPISGVITVLRTKFHESRSKIAIIAPAACHVKPWITSYILAENQN